LDVFRFNGRRGDRIIAELPPAAGLAADSVLRLTRRRKQWPSTTTTKIKATG